MNTFPTSATFIMKNQNNVGSLIYNNQVIGSKNLLGNNKSLSFEINSNSNRTFTIKDIKVKPL